MTDRLIYRSTDRGWIHPTLPAKQSRIRLLLGIPITLRRLNRKQETFVWLAK